MKVVAINGSPKVKGNTYQALEAMAGVLAEQGIETSILQVGKERIGGCVGCNTCAVRQDRQCVFKDDIVNDAVEQLAAADGIIVGSPVYYAGLNGSLKSFLDRVFYVCGANHSLLRHKVGVAVAVARREGGTPTVDQINKYFQITEMILPSGNYWTAVHGGAPGEVLQDTEGMHTLLTAAANMGWVMRLIQHGKQAVPAPAFEARPRTNFIR